MFNHRIVLASASPSRQLLLKSAGVDPIIYPANVDEFAIIGEFCQSPAEEIVSHLAAAKAQQVHHQFPQDIVIGADSMLFINNELQGKPHTVQEMISRWQHQRGRSGELLTGHAVFYQGQSVVGVTSTKVHFGQISDDDIVAYAESGEALECAGAFTLEARGGWFIDSIEGDPSSVIGLSMPFLRKALYQFGLNASDVWTKQT